MQTRAVLIPLIVSLAAMAACNQPMETDLKLHRWVLESINGDALPAAQDHGKIPEMNFDEQMRVTGNNGCNQVSGQAVLRDGFFLIETMASTRMMCPPPWRDIELIVQAALTRESAISLDSDRNLTLRSADTTLVFRLEDRATK